MRHALRRVLWIVPTLVVVSILAFFVLSKSIGWTPPGEPGQSASAARARLARLPRFFNAKPRDVRALARAAMRDVSSDAPNADQARALLVRLGGAALPFVLPRLDALPPEGRARVALALRPVARRMGVSSPEELGNADGATVFWSRFWQERSIDFRGVVVRRMVQRVELRASAFRREDVEQLDTFALADLIADMGRVATPADVGRVRLLADLAAHATGLPWRVPAGASVAEARGVVAAWHNWWLLYGSDFVAFDGPRRVVAMLVETQYGKWASATVHNTFGVTAEGTPLIGVIESRAPVTLWLLLAGLGGGYAVGIAAGLLAAARELGGFDALSSLGALMLLGVPSAELAAWTARIADGVTFSWMAALIMIVVCAALVSRFQRAASRTALEQEFCRTERAFGASPIAAARRSFRASSAAALSLVAVDLPAVIGTAFVVERGFGLKGLGPATLDAVAAHDLPWLMTMALLTAIVVALAQIASDVLLGALDPRVRASLDRHRGVVD
jgi:peptide/nickel transport system permease protein